MAARTVGDEEEVARPRWVGHRLERGAARIGDRAGRQPVDGVGVVRGGRVAILDRDLVAVRLTLAAEHAVNDRRVGLEAHVEAEPVDEHGGDARPLIGERRLLLDDRGHGREFVDAGERQVGRAAGPDFGQHPVALAHHDVEDVGAGIAAAEGVGVGQYRALRRNGRGGADQCSRRFAAVRLLRAGEAGDVLAGRHAVRSEAGDHLLAGQAFGDGDPIDDALALDHQVHDRPHRGLRGDGVFAGLEVVALAAQPDAGDEQPLRGDDAVALEAVGDVADAGTLVDGDGPGLVEAARPVELHLSDQQPAAQHDPRDDDDGKDEIEEDDERMADRTRALRRRRNGFGLKGFGRALRVRPGSQKPGGPTGRRRRYRTDPFGYRSCHASRPFPLCAGMVAA